MKNKESIKQQLMYWIRGVIKHAFAEPRTNETSGITYWQPDVFEGVYVPVICWEEGFDETDHIDGYGLCLSLRKPKKGINYIFKDDMPYVGEPDYADSIELSEYDTDARIEDAADWLIEQVEFDERGELK